MIAGALVVVAFVVACALAASLIHDFYRPWLDRRYAAERLEQRELTEWIAALRSMSDAGTRASAAMGTLGDAFAAMRDITRRPRPGPGPRS